MNDHDWAEPELQRDDVVLVALIAGTIAFAALALGAVQAWSEQVVQAGAAATAAATAWQAMRVRRAALAGDPAAAPLPAWWVVTPVALFLLLVVVQLFPLPAGVVSALSPEAMRLRRELLADLPDLESRLATSTLTLYAEGGWRQLRMLLCAAAVFLAAASLAPSRPARRRLTWSLLVVGAAVAAIAIGHQVLGVEAIWNRFTVPRPPARSAPFINHSHFAQFMNLSIGFALATALWAAHEFRADRRPRSASDWLDAARQGQVNGLILAAVAAAAMVAALTLSGSRGGLIALAAGLVAMLGAGAATPAGRGGGRPALLLLGAGVIVAAALTWAVSDHAHRRIAGLAEPAAGGDRLLILQGLVPAWKAFPVAGTGLGTFEFVYPMYDRTRAINLTTHAENEYAHVLTEAGVPGLALAIWFLAAVGWCVARCLRRGGPSGQVALGLLFGVVAILVHSLGDFGQHLPANALMTAAACGLIVGMARRASRGSSPAGAPGGAGVRATRMAIAAAGVGIALVALLPQADATRRAEAAARSARPIVADLQAAGWSAGDDAFAAALGPLTRAVELRPGDVRHRFDLNVLRYYAITRNASGTLPRVAATAPATQPADPARVEQARRNAARVVGELNAIRLLCPTFGEAYSMAGQIRRSMGDDVTGRALMAQAMRLSTYDGVTMLFNAEEAMAAGNVEEAKRLFRSAIDLLAVSDEAVIERFAGQYGRPDDALAFAGDRRHLLRAAAEALRRHGHAAQAAEAERRGEAALRREAEEPAAPAAVDHEMARLLQKNGDRDGAIKQLRRAVLRQPDRAEWRLELARLLADAGDVGGAIEQVEAAIRHRGNSPQAARMLEELRSRPNGR